MLPLLLGGSVDGAAVEPNRPVPAALSPFGCGVCVWPKLKDGALGFGVSDGGCDWPNVKDDVPFCCGCDG